MTVKSAQQWSGLVVCKDATGALAAPSVGPVGVLYVNGAVNAAAVTITGTNPYKWTVTLPVLTAGDVVSMYITATISLIATASVVAEAVGDTSRVSDVATTIGVAGAGLTALGDTRLDHLDEDVSSRAAPGDAMSLSELYDAAKTAAQAGDAMNLVDAPNSTAVAAIQSGLALAGGDGDTLETLSDQLDGVATPADVPTTGQIADAVWDEATSGHATTGTFGALLAGLVASIVAALTASATYLAAVATRVWANAARTLTQTAAQIATALTGTSLSIQRGDTLTLSLTGLGNLSGRSKLYFAVKEDPLGDVDSEALLLVEETGGLLTVNKAACATPTNGSITVTDEAAGNVTITVKPAATALLPPGLRRYAAVEAVIAGAVSTLAQYDRTVTITADVVRATA